MLCVLCNGILASLKTFRDRARLHLLNRRAVALEVTVAAREVTVAAREVTVAAREVTVAAREVTVAARE